MATKQHGKFRLVRIERIVPAFDRGFRVFRHTLACGHTVDRQAKDNRPRKFTFYGRPRQLRCYECVAVSK